MNEPRIIPVGQEPPPLRPSPSTNGANGRPARQQGQGSKAKGKPARRKTGNRFAVLNAFVDAGMVGLSRVELATWLVLYRDTKDGTACTSEDNIAARAGCSKRAVTKAVGRLRRRGLLVQVFRGGINRGPSRYRVLPIPKPPKELGNRVSL
jgi:biotin operon repressor